MTPHIIHDPNHETSGERMQRLTYEMQRQGIQRYYLHPAVYSNIPTAGCSIAHKCVILWAREHGLKRICVMEDDVKFGAPDSFAYYLSKMPKEFDLYLGGVNCDYPIAENGLTRQFCGTHCYIIDERFYDVLLSADENRNIDLWLGNRGMYYVCYPFAAVQYDGMSQITKSVRTWGSTLQNRKIYGVSD